MFEADLSKVGGIDVHDQHHVMAGNRVNEPCFSPIGYLGLSVSYDVRFPELYRHMVLKGAQVFLVPSAFLAKTGASHWETLLRTRAIENQSYVIAAAQVGNSNQSRLSFGHSMVVDPWGDIIGQASDKEGYFLCELDMTYLDKVRGQMNCLTHVRHGVLI